jgi:prophage regulatory protein
MFRRRELPAFTGLKRTAINEAMARGEFPKPVRVGASAVAWLESDLVAWQQERKRIAEMESA